MTFGELKEKALSLPLVPGVYIMRDAQNKVIYVGKAKKLKNRVSQYFQDSAGHSPKTKMMVSKIFQFDVITATSEFEALILECSLIKRYMPKYNILLKDDKGYPYVRLDMTDEYPVLTMVNKLAHDRAEYFGPYGSRGVTQDLLDAIRVTFGLPGCNKKFPADAGKERPCLNYHMNQCRGWCQLSRTPQEYREVMNQVRLLLMGDYQKLVHELKRQMLLASENLEFERAAELRDRVKAVETLGKKQLVTAGTLADTDAIGFAQSGGKSCFVVMHYSGGNLLDKEYELLSYQDNEEAAISSLVKQYYLSRGIAPQQVLLPVEMEDAQLFSDMLLQNTGKRTRFRVPKRGDLAQMLELACANAREEVGRATSREEKISGTMTMLGKMLSLPTPPRRIESFDISNLAGTDIVASMVVFVDGKPSRKDYRKFKIRDLPTQDDYASMYQAVKRRFLRLQSGDPGFVEPPDLLLIDGGSTHASVARGVLDELGLSLPVFGMVKDDRHRTRALVTPEEAEIGISAVPAVFAFIGTIQEETHRFAITYSRNLRTRRLRESRLDEIPGIGASRKEMLLKHFGSVAAIGRADLPELERLLPKNVAASVYGFFHKGETDLCG